MFFQKDKNPYRRREDWKEEETDLFPVILHFTPAAIYVYEDKEDSHVWQDQSIELWDAHDTMLTGTLIVLYVKDVREALERYKVNELGLPVIHIDLIHE